MNEQMNEQMRATMLENHIKFASEAACRVVTRCQQPQGLRTRNELFAAMLALNTFAYHEGALNRLDFDTAMRARDVRTALEDIIIDATF